MVNTGITTIIQTAANILMEYWPLNAFIATNPLWKLRNKSFFEVVTQSGIEGLMDIDYYHARYQEKKISRESLEQAIAIIENRRLCEADLNRWIAQSRAETQALPSIAFLFAEQMEEYQFQKPLVWIREKIFTLLRNYFGLSHYKKNTLKDFWYAQNSIQDTEIHTAYTLPVIESIALLVKKIGIPESILVNYFQAIYLQSYGWSSLMNWRNQHPDNPWIPGEDACEIVLLMWLSYEYLIATERQASYQCSQCSTSNNTLQKRYIWQTALELDYWHHLESKLSANFSSEKKHYDAQFIFCIDTRSEGFRRHLETQGNFQTFGFAGFFGAAFNMVCEDDVFYQAPALVKAGSTLTAKKNSSSIAFFICIFGNMINYAKKQLLAPFSLFEMLGFWFLPFMLFKTMQPALKVVAGKKSLKINNTLSEEEQFQSAYKLLTAIGMVTYFSKRVFICSHQSDNVNNPFKSSLNCGACGGNSGIPNAIVMCNILNKKNIRLRLNTVNIAIPDATTFVPACHHTSYDRLEILEGEIPEPLEKAIGRAAEKLRCEKRCTLPGVSQLSAREKNWSELIPDLGLINNATIIIGPRAITRGYDLERRAFLHSYDPNLDHNGDILTGILSAPAIVAHWISSQYYFSTVNPDQFGAGNKAIHNVLPGIGVMEGNLSDLKIGLPLQSTHFQSIPVHVPTRIIVVIYANRETLDIAIQRSPDFAQLLANQWIHLRHIAAKKTIDGQ